jgi:hypothetical protein
MNLQEKYRHTRGDPWKWASAAGSDIQDIVDLVTRTAGKETKGITELNPVEGSRNLMHAIVNQMYAPKAEMISVCRLKETKELVAFNWCGRDVRQVWSTEEMVVPKHLSIENRISARCRIALCVQAMTQWERWAQITELKLINSSSMRVDWQTFMHIHRELGYQVRGSMAFKRLNEIKLEAETGRIILA